jgi:hypothetical protein
MAQVAEKNKFIGAIALRFQRVDETRLREHFLF